MRKYFEEAKKILSIYKFQLTVLIILIVGLGYIYNHIMQASGWNQRITINRSIIDRMPRTTKDLDFIRICKQGYWENIINAIKNGANVNVRDADFGNTQGSNRGRTPLMFVVGDDLQRQRQADYYHSNVYSRMEVIEALIDAGADVSARDNAGKTPLMIAAEDICSPEIITYLINAGADVNAQNNSGMTALMFAAIAAYNKQNPIAVTDRAYHDMGMDPKADYDKFMRDSEEISLRIYDVEVITTLLDFGADPNIVDDNNRKAIDYASENDKLINREAFRRLQNVSY